MAKSLLLSSQYLVPFCWHFVLSVIRITCSRFPESYREKHLVRRERNESYQINRMLINDKSTASLIVELYRKKRSRDWNSSGKTSMKKKKSVPLRVSRGLKYYVFYTYISNSSMTLVKNSDLLIFFIFIILTFKMSIKQFSLLTTSSRSALG